MNEQSYDFSLNKSWLTIRIVWTVLFGSLGVYFLISTFVGAGREPAPDVPLGLLKNIFSGLAITLFAAAYIVRKKMIGAVDADRRSSPRPAGAPDQAATGRYLTAIIVTATLSETIGAFGLVLFFLSGDAATLYQFLILSAIAMLTYRPRKDEFLRFIGDRQKRAGRQ